MSFLRALGAWLVCGLLAYGGCAFVHMGYDWGYYLVEKWLGQPSPGAVNQGVMALHSLTHIIFPMFAGMYCGIATAISRRQRLGEVGALALGCVPLFVDSLGGGSRDPLAMLSALIPIGTAYLFFRFGFSTFRFLQQRLKPLQLYIPGLLVVVPSAVYGLIASNGMGSGLAYWQEALLYSTAIAASSAIAARLTRAADAEVGVLAGAIANSPILLANLINLVGNLGSLLLDRFHVGADLGWSALASAIAISTLCLASLLVGGALGAVRAHAMRP